MPVFTALPIVGETDAPDMYTKKMFAVGSEPVTEEGEEGRGEKRRLYRGGHRKEKGVINCVGRLPPLQEHKTVSLISIGEKKPARS